MSGLRETGEDASTTDKIEEEILDGIALPKQSLQDGKKFSYQLTDTLLHLEVAKRKRPRSEGGPARPPPEPGVIARGKSLYQALVAAWRESKADGDLPTCQIVEGQLFRCVGSVAGNWAEGIGRGTGRQVLHFKRIARGSAYETVAFLGLLPPPYSTTLLTQATELSDLIDDDMESQARKMVKQLQTGYMQF